MFSNARPVALSVSLGLVTACGLARQAGNQGSSSAELQQAPTLAGLTATDGTRLRVRHLTFGAESLPIDFYDAKLGEVCTPVQTDAGLRCGPTSAIEMQQSQIYLDPLCAAPAARAATFPGGGVTCKLESPHFWSLQKASTSCTRDPRLGFYAPADPKPVKAGTQLYVRDVNGDCSAEGVVPSSDVHAVYAIRPADGDLAPLDIREMPGHEHDIRGLVVVGDDGSQLAHTRGRIHIDRTDCALSPEGYCWPIDAIPISEELFSGPGCTKRVALAPSLGCVAHYAVGPYTDPTGQQPVTTALFLAGAPASSLYYQDLYHPCGGFPASAATLRRTFEVGEKAAGMSTAVRMMGTDRIRASIAFDERGVALGPAIAPRATMAPQYFDSALATMTSAAATRDGVSRFVPTNTTASEALFWEDAAMTLPLIITTPGRAGVTQRTFARRVLDHQSACDAPRVDVYTEQGDAFVPTNVWTMSSEGKPVSAPGSSFSRFLIRHGQRLDPSSLQAVQITADTTPLESGPSDGDAGAETGTGASSGANGEAPRTGSGTGAATASADDSGCSATDPRAPHSGLLPWLFAVAFGAVTTRRRARNLRSDRAS